MDLFLGSQFCSIDLCICFSVNTMVFWLLQLCNTVWNQGVWYLQLCSFFPRKKISLTIQGLLWFHINFRFFGSILVKNVLGILIEIALNLLIALGNMDILTMLIFPIHEHGISFHLFVSSSISFTVSYSFQCTWLNLFLGICCYCGGCKWDCFLNSLLLAHCQHKETQLTFFLINLFIYLFIFGCVGSLLLHTGFL